MKILGLIVLLAVLSGGCTEKSTGVRLHGQLKDMGTQNVVMRYDGAASLIGDSRNIILHTDAEGRFDTVIALEKPEYYSISRNTLYLTPGDELEVMITQNNREAEFKGKGAEANTYLKERLFPKGGSYLDGGSNVRADFRQTRQIIDSLAFLRGQQLASQWGLSDEFRELENGRIYADVINSYLYYKSYATEYNGKTEEEVQAAEQQYRAEVAPSVVNKVYSLNNDRFLDVAVVRNILFYAEDAEYADFFKPYVATERYKELYEGFGKVSLLRGTLSQQVVDEINTYLDTMKNPDFAAELRNKVDRAARLLPGQPAIDIVLTDTAGQQKKLSDFKGKPIYVDLWATWCGPCIQESPAFNALSAEYPEIEFVQISTDQQREAWMSYLSHKQGVLPQYNSVDMQLTEGWQIFYIPRFILIDKDFKILNAYAPRPSSEEIKTLLESIPAV